MSHLAHINAYKQSLIQAGITNPETQIVLTRTAYTCAFIRLFQQLQVPETDRRDVMIHILSYWNETFPVNGNIILGAVRGFQVRLYDAVASAKGNVFVEISQEQEVKDNPTFNDPDTYEALVQCLFEEAVHKYKQHKGA